MPGVRESYELCTPGILLNSAALTFFQFLMFAK
jgi:hypothetical protein